ncbi:autolysin [Clostridium puniceum]|uniref:Autolysin n=1 Tax=Clostridium puniceum TaxID=29367 RepID=A0A1S8TMK1_9CLOT|nr:N-acetylmuramoyl-L-alanine amidase family protein [Clostridium puniceum]OOM78993.1 autolysin [Clostridium puniceum]
MIKRVSKATSLLLAAAAVISLVPATSANAATLLETKDGTIEQAIAFDGGYIFNGYKADTDETGVYYNNGTSDKLLEDIDSTDMSKYGTKYAKIEDSSDEYLVDLSTGKVLEDETTEDRIDTTKSKLKSTLSKTDRYGKVNSTNDITLDQISKGSFGEVWYSYVTTGASSTHSGYVNEAGKYIDTDVTANIYVSNGTRMVKVEEFGKTNKDFNITVDLVDAKTIAQDSEYIYRIVDVNVTNATTTSSATYLQKISKAQGTEEDDAYLPNTVASYEITSAFDSDDADDAATTLGDITNADFRVINGVIYVTKKNSDSTSVSVTTLKLKKDKVTLKDASTKLDAYLVEQDVNEDQDIMGENAVSIDVDGNTWALNKGKILKFDGTEFKAVYDCDRAMDTLEVYDADSLIAWEEGEDVYAVVDKDDTTIPETPVENKGWVQTAAGWTFYNASGSQIKGQWVNDGGVWYMIKADGIMATGWYNDNGTWYYLSGSGAMKTGWLNDNGTWYYLAGSGAMKTGWLNDNGTWYYLSGSGAMKTGWLNDNGTWYYLNGSGAMLANTVVDGYRLGASGAWAK